MEKLIVYFVSRVYAEIPKKRAYSPMVFVEGSAFSYEGTEDEYAEFLTFSLSEAKEHLRKLKTEMWDFVQYMWIKEWGLIERVYDFDGIKKDFPEIQTKEDFLQKLTEDPWGDLAQYEIDSQSGWIHEYSKREYEAFVKTDKGTYTAKFSSYRDALNWIDEMETEKEEEGIKISRINL